MGRDQEVVKRSGREEPVWVAIHKCMEAMLGISLYLKLAKMLCLSYLSSFLFNKIREQRAEQVLPEKGDGGEQCIHM
jgi:hypothetical protein